MQKKILLIHGWDYRNYTKNGGVDAWANRSQFVEMLRKQFEVISINLPGFCGTPDPSRPWTLNDFTNYVGEIIEQEKPNLILGYSFGGAIALQWKRLTRDVTVETFLVSPAILRRYKQSDLSTVQKLFKAILPQDFVSVLRDFYLIHIVKNPYYIQATKVMRETYRNIVSIDLSEDLLYVKDSLTLVYGEKDSATPPNLVQEALDQSSSGHSLHIIAGGGHDIANSHTDKLISIITGGKK